MSDTERLVLKSSDAAQVAKLLRMLRSTLRRYPSAKLERTRDGFGASLDASTSMRIRLSGSLTEQDIRDLLALFATWLVVDGAYLRAGGTPLAGFSAEGIERPN